jgi:hypothetical protein
MPSLNAAHTMMRDRILRPEPMKMSGKPQRARQAKRLFLSMSLSVTVVINRTEQPPNVAGRGQGSSRIATGCYNAIING